MPQIPFTAPMECLPVQKLAEGDGWVYELKLDGYRAQGIYDSGGVRLLSKNGKDLSKKFPIVVAALEESLSEGTVVDGELVALDSEGRPSFNALQNANTKTPVVFYAFDILMHRGEDTKALPLHEWLSTLDSAFVPQGNAVPL